MKKFISIVAALVMTTSMFALDLSAGLRVTGGTLKLFNTMQMTDSDGKTQSNDFNSDFGPVFGFGGVFGVGINKNFGVSTEVLYKPVNQTTSDASSMGIDTSLIDASAKLNLQTLEIPVLFQYKLKAGPGKLVASVGPSFNFIVGDIKSEITVTIPFFGTQTMEDSYSPKDQDINIFVIGAVAGAEYQYPLGPGFIEAGVRTYIDVMNLNKNSNADKTGVKSFTRKFGITADAGYSIKF